MNFPPLYAHLMLGSLLILLCGCERTSDVKPATVEEYQVPVTENMTDQEWMAFRNRSIENLVTRYTSLEKNTARSNSISIEPLQPLEELSPLETEKKPYKVETPPHKVEEKIIDNIEEELPHKMEQISAKVENKPCKTEQKPNKVEQYSQLQVQPEEAKGKTYKVPPNAVTGGHNARIDIPQEKPSEAHSVSDTKAQLAREKGISKNSYDFIWPVKGRVVQNYGANKNGFNNGINIHTHTGTPVLAIREGTVLYVGNAIKELGNIILIKHPNEWVSAYAHVQNISVKKDMHVTQGQPIAQVGGSSKDSSEFHFEIRKGRKSFDPMKFLPKD